MKELKFIEDERCNQFRTMKNANRLKKKLVRLVGPHYIAKSITWRDLEPFYCYTVVLGCVKKW